MLVDFLRCLSRKSPSKKLSNVMKEIEEQKQPAHQIVVDTCQIEIKIEKEEVNKKKFDQEHSVLLAVGTHRASELESESEREREKKDQKENLESTVSLIMNHSYLAEQADSFQRISAVNREVGK